MNYTTHAQVMLFLLQSVNIKLSIIYAPNKAFSAKIMCSSTLVFPVHIASTLVYRFPRACKLQWLSSLMRHHWFHTPEIYSTNNYNNELSHCFSLEANSMSIFPNVHNVSKITTISGPILCVSSLLMILLKFNTW